MGLDRLRSMIHGGLPQGAVVLLDGPPGAGKSSVALQLLADHMSEGGTALVVATETSPDDIMRAWAGATEGSPTVPPALWILDCYSWRTGQPCTLPQVVPMRSLNDLSTLSIALTQAIGAAAIGGRPLLVVFDTPSSFILHASPGAILKFFEIAFAKTRNARATTLVLLEKGVHDEAFMSHASIMCDGVIDLRLDDAGADLQRMMRVRAMRNARLVQQKWMPLLLDAAGRVELMGAAASTPAVAQKA